MHKIRNPLMLSCQLFVNIIIIHRTLPILKSQVLRLYGSIAHDSLPRFADWLQRRVIKRERGRQGGKGKNWAFRFADT